jgi:hypothetical protein
MAAPYFRLTDAFSGRAMAEGQPVGHQVVSLPVYVYACDMCNQTIENEYCPDHPSAAVHSITTR